MSQTVTPVAQSKKTFFLNVHGKLCCKFCEDLSKIVITIFFTDGQTDVGDFISSPHAADHKVYKNDTVLF